MPKVVVGDVPFKEAIAFFKKKVKIPTENWDDMLGDIHAKAFTVAGATNMDVLTDIHKAVQSALENGTTITEFRKAFDKTVQKNGWSYKGKRGWRTRIIYDTNLRTAHMAGKWEQFQRVKATRPYLQYLTVGDSRVRPQHAAWNKITLPVDDDWFSTHYPPNGWGCRCTVRSLSKSQLKRQGLSVNKAPKVNKSRRFNPETGQDYGLVPDGIDTGWDYNVGKSWLGPDIGFGTKAIKLPEAIRKAVLDGTNLQAEIISAPFSTWAKKTFKRNQSRNEIITAGFLSDPVISFALAKGINVETAVITISDSRLLRMRRDFKDKTKKIAIAQDELEKLPEHLASPKAILWDKLEDAVLYIFQQKNEDRLAKVFLAISIENLKDRFSVIRSGGLIPEINLNDKSRYEVIEGKI